MFTSMFFRLFSRAPLIVRNPVGFLRSSGTGILILPLKYAPVLGQRDIVEKTQRLIDAANENGGKDNITVVLIEPFSDETR